MATPLKISAVLIVKNEEPYLKDSLTSLLFCDEIVVVDSGSTDRTQAIACDAGAPWSGKMIWRNQPWLGFSEQRNFALSLATKDWIICVDGDERVSPALARELQQIVTEEQHSPAVWCLHRQEYFLRKPIFHGTWNPSYHPRFFPRSQAYFEGDIHESLISRLPRKKTRSSLLHVEDLRVERILGKLNQYTTIQAENDVRIGRTTSVLKILLAFPAMFFKNLFIYGAIKDGIEGVIISVLEGVSRTVRHVKIWQIYRLRKNR